MKPADMNWLQKQWQTLMAFYQVAETQSEQVFDEIVKRYEENGRYYHTLRHIQSVLEAIDSLHTCAEDLAAIQLAAWFHDIIYDVRRSDNETQSAVYAGNVLHSLGIDPATITKVGYMIRATTHNGSRPSDIDSQIMLDADLATFASDWEMQMEIEQAIRQEYAFVPDEAFREGRQIILRNFLERKRIYFTEKMYLEREEAARQNISRTIADLENR